MKLVMVLVYTLCLFGCSDRPQQQEQTTQQPEKKPITTPQQSKPKPDINSMPLRQERIACFKRLTPIFLETHRVWQTMPGDPCKNKMAAKREYRCYILNGEMHDAYFNHLNDREKLEVWKDSKYVGMVQRGLSTQSAKRRLVQLMAVSLIDPDSFSAYVINERDMKRYDQELSRELKVRNLPCK